VPVSSVGPKVTGVSVLKVRHRTAGLVIHFSEAISSGSASNTASYSVHLVVPGRRTRHGIRQASIGKAVGVASAAYDPSGLAVTLTFGSRLAASQVFQLRVSGGVGGISDTAGNPLNSPSRGVAGSDYVASIDPRAV
jgi:hypothetical protein